MAQGKRKGRTAQLLTSGMLAGCAATNSSNPAPNVPTPEISTLPPQLEVLIALPQHRRAVIGAAQHSTTWLHHGCPRAAYAILPGARIWVTPAFTATGVPLAGMWRESVLATGCGRARVLNTVTTVRGPNVVSTGLAAPGTTRGTLVLQMDAHRYTLPILAMKASACGSTYLDDTAVTVPAAPDGGAWTEVWTWDACGVLLPVQLDFTPSGGGTDILAHAL